MRTTLLLSLGLLLGACAHQSAPMGDGPDAHHHRFDDAADWAKRFEDPKRDAWQKPDEVLRLLALSPDAKVADIGSATGYFPVRVAQQVPRGHVYGVDVESTMVEYLNARAEREGRSNLTSLLGAPDDAKLPELVDLVMVVDTYHHIEARPVYFKKLLASVKPSGRLVIIDFTKASSMGPPSAAKLEPAQVEAELAAAGWSLVATHDVLPEQYFLVFSRS